ncbi:MAG: FAD-dependent oxidoreductase [Moraxellaceae bacterium]|nr:FAD-dependent oxidoreductase [Moraxellaceae bacterium]MDP1775150.1 FAD-dependent oxidoreductase [Moraxellaceae bacterium]MDZ4297654.1 FAD-dependent oxidoreductase [Moraxellaceae bacterium]MDZ4385927.1 FAD-dependent oxidoreductase [Moraxellaceae bacterium]
MHIVLVGGGHAHLGVVHEAARFHRVGLSLTLVDAGDFCYSGMATGMLAGCYSMADASIDLAQLCAAFGVRHIAAQVLDVDRQQQTLILSDGQALGYDLVSFNVGSVAAHWSPENSRPEGAALWPVKPITELSRFIAVFEQSLTAGISPSVTVVGDGVTAAEVAANIAYRVTAAGLQPRVQIQMQGPTLAKQLPAGAQQALKHYLLTQGVTLINQGAVTASDHMIWAAGLQAPPLMQRLGLVNHPVQGLAVHSTWQSLSDKRVFAIGDCAYIASMPLAKLGVHGVRGALVLTRNLLAAAQGLPLKAYRPRAFYLSILHLSPSMGLAVFGRFWWLGRYSRYVKDWIDRRFMAAMRP